ncbi:MAG: cobalamin-independent methionine synthase II family protein [Armatimonadetes bacterium]|nr:cobalamin-independent methionine synthase II family protein [Armatimonadota bacterium]
MKIPDLPILTTVVGSYPAPSWLMAYPSKPNLRDAVMVVLKLQELAGVDVVSDGELSRFDPSHPETQGMIEYFIKPMDGIKMQFSREDIAAFRSEARLHYRTQPAGVVVGKIGSGTLNLPEDFALARSLTDKPLKFTVTSPYMLAQVLLDRYYNDKVRLAWDLAEVLRQQVSLIDAEVVQVDEAHLTGHPEDWNWAVEVINHVLSAVKGEAAVHLCFGNYGGQTIQKGFWRDLIPFFNALKASHVVLEFARRSFAELEVFKEVKPELALGIGVVDIKDNEVESPETVARRIEHAVKTLGQERVRWVHPDCGLWMLHRSIAERKLKALVQGRNLFLGLEKAT